MSSAGVVRARLGLALCFTLAVAQTGGAFAGPGKKTKVTTKLTATQWKQAEATLRTHFEAAKRALLEVKPYKDLKLGTTFWVRYQAGGGGLVAVRGDSVISDKGDASISAVLRADDFLKTRGLDATDFVYMLRNLGGELPEELRGNIITKHKDDRLNPRWEFEAGQARLIVFTHRVGNHEASPSIFVYQGKFEIDASYGVRWAKIEAVQLPPAKKSR
ncbi:MAG: hypothetical protein IT370_33175 [Deltaproteobacteria bacterium]|nr:hypothetical protein [Deltaproteobacteria bacterium]